MVWRTSQCTSQCMYITARGASHGGLSIVCSAYFCVFCVVMNFCSPINIYLVIPEFPNASLVGLDELCPRFRSVFVNFGGVVGRHRTLRLPSGLNRSSLPDLKWSKRGLISLDVPGHDPPFEITIYCLFLLNPGPVSHRFIRGQYVVSMSCKTL